MSGTVQIVKGEDKTIVIQFQKLDGTFYDLTGYTGISVSFENADLTTLTLTSGGGAVTVLSPVLGKIQVVLTDAQTALLKLGTKQPIYATIDVGTNKTIVVDGLDKAVSVVSVPF